MQETALLELRGICKFFPGVRALDGVDFTLRKGEIHALMGENGAGKSTLIKIINGMHHCDTGEIWFQGNQIHPQNPKQMLEMGVATIHQELSPITELSIAENIFLGREPRTKMHTVDYKRMFRETQALMDRFGFTYDPRQKVKTLSISDIQLVEMMKAVSRNAALVIMDEPTSSITETESKVLFRCISELKADGISIIYISHKMDEVFDICDEITIFRDGKWIHTSAIKDIERSKVIEYMVGRELNDAYPKRELPIGDVMLELRNLSREGVFENINFKSRKGEIVGIAGLVGAGRSELFSAVFGLDKIDSGEVYIEGKQQHFKTAQDAVDQGLVMTPEDRKVDGLVLYWSILENASLKNLKNYLKMGMIQPKLEKQSVTEMLKKFSIKMSSIYAPCSSLSGGNQQKVVLAKWLLTEPKILILDEPTRGIDIGAKYEIYKFMCDIAEQGVSVIMISSELPELIGMCDRIAVMSKGHLTGEVLRGDFSQEKIMALAMEGQ